MTTGVLVMAYGTPRDRDDIVAYYTDIRRGRPPTPELLAELTARYDALGGTFPLREITDRQVRAVADSLDRTAPGEFVVEHGTKHSHPSIEEGVARLVDRGVDRVVGLVLAPHYSRFSVGEYAARTAAAAAAAGLAATTIESWHLLPAYVDFVAAAVTRALDTVGGDAEVVFTAHSLPERILSTGDPYPDELRATAETVARRLALESWSVAWQSAGRTPEPWLGPDIRDVVADRAAAGKQALVACACGFVADHLEVAYDLDIEAAAVAADVGIRFTRTASVNDDPTVMAALADLVRTA